MAGKGTRKDFVEWLRSKKPRARVGWSWGAANPEEWAEGEYRHLCPIGFYAAETGARPEYSVQKWVRDFQEAVDGGYSPEPQDPTARPVTARKCLHLLGEDV